MNHYFTAHKETITAGALAVITFAVYLQTLAPTVGFIDSGELATTAITLGVAHPTGYPLFTLLGKLFSSVPVAAEEIVRLNIFSAVSVSVGIVIFFFFLLQFFGEGKRNYSHIIASAFSSLSLAFSQTVWKQAVSVEVYSLHIIFLPLILLLFTKAILSDEPRWWLMFAFATGLSFTNHMTTILLAPALLYWFFAEHGVNRVSFKKMAQLSIPFAAGLSVYLFLPIRAAQHPLLNWGNPQTVEKFWWHISGKQFRVWMFSSSDAAQKQLHYFFERLPSEFFYFPLFLALVGIFILLFSEKKKFVFILLLFVGCIGYSINYDIHDIDSYFILAFVALAIAVSFGVLKIAGLITSKGIKSVSVGLLIVFLILQARANWSETDQSENYLVEDYTKTILTNLPPNSIVISYQWDYFVAASYYFQHVKNLRPDVVVLDKELFRRSWYFPQIKKMYPSILKKSKIGSELFQQELYKFEHDLPYQFEAIEGRYALLLKSILDNNIDSVSIYITPEIEQQYTAGYQRIPETYLYRLTKDASYSPVPFPKIYFRPFLVEDKYSFNIRQLSVNALMRRGGYERYYGQDSLAQLYYGKSAEMVATKSSKVSTF